MSTFPDADRLMMTIKKIYLKNKTDALIHTGRIIHEPLEPQEKRRGLVQLSTCLMRPSRDTYIPVDRAQCARTRIEMYTKN